MSNYSIEAIELQIASEVNVDASGKSTFSIRAIERISDVSVNTIGQSLRSIREGKTPSKLVQILTECGFDVRGFSENGIPDIAAARIIEYYAFEAGARCTPQALLAFRSFASAGIRVWAHKITGWTPEQKPDIDIQTALKQYVEGVIPEIPSEWQCRYTKPFWAHLERLYGLQRGDKGCASIIHNYIYCKLPEVIRDRLDEVNPLIDGSRRHKQHQHFDKEMLSYLLSTIQKVTDVMAIASNKEEFQKLVRRVPKLKLNAEIASRLLR